MRCLLIVAMTAWAGAAGADLYRWVDPETGSGKFSSYPPPWYGDEALQRRSPRVEHIPAGPEAPAPSAGAVAAPAAARPAQPTVAPPPGPPPGAPSAAPFAATPGAASPAPARPAAGPPPR